MKRVSDEPYEKDGVTAIPVTRPRDDGSGGEGEGIPGEPKGSGGGFGMSSSPAEGRRTVGQWSLIALQLVTGTCAVLGGALLAVAPDGSMLRADPSVLDHAPFTDWRMPGVLLTVLVGGGLSFAGCWQWHDGRHAPAVSMLAGLGLVSFEAAELRWIGFQPLEGVFALVGAAIFSLAALQTRT